MLPKTIQVIDVAFACLSGVEGELLLLNAVHIEHRTLFNTIVLAFMCMNVLLACQHTMCMQCLWRPEEVIWIL